MIMDWGGQGTKLIYEMELARRVSQEDAALQRSTSGSPDGGLGFRTGQGIVLLVEVIA